MQSTQSLNRQIIAIAWPAIVSNITTPLLGLVDTAIAGHLGAAAYLGAIALGSTLCSLIYWLFGFLRMGTAGITSQAFGAGDGNAVSSALFRSLLIAAASGVLLIVFSEFFSGNLLTFLDADDTTQPLAESYFSIVIFGAPAMLATFSLNGWLIGQQNTRLPMAIAILTNIVNIAASFIFVFLLGMKIEGIALGTLLSQWIAAIVCLFFAVKRFRPRMASAATLFRGTDFRRLLSINTDIFLRTLCMVVVTAWFTRSGASQSVDILAANALLMQLFLFFSYFSDGFAYAGEALAGKFFGGRLFKQLYRLIRNLLLWGATLSIVFSAVYFFLGEWILHVLTDRGEIVNRAAEYLPWAVSVPLCGCVAFIYDGIFTGLTLTRRMLLSVGAGMIVFFAVYFPLIDTMGNHALWLAFISYLIVRGVVLHITLPKMNKLN